MITKRLTQAIVILKDVGSLESGAMNLIPVGIAVVVKQKITATLKRNLVTISKQRNEYFMAKKRSMLSNARKSRDAKDG